ncbi:hypothetical protein MSG28_007557 [Choristoneura fumiferana]|uniref:Uncharacterized protein n=1 Tax=Choristoneura fumiferana TaxID=7141 RepID=A0ACC0JYB7_CHOFU|nr:hypothetical protein MSG28_007557 [Choristoneura fumiferana]
MPSENVYVVMSPDGSEATRSKRDTLSFYQDPSFEGRDLKRVKRRHRRSLSEDMPEDLQHLDGRPSASSLTAAAMDLVRQTDWRDSQCAKFTFCRVALKRQQAAEDKIALHLASVESGTALDALPPGRIYGMRVTGPCPSPGAEPDSAADDQTALHDKTVLASAGSSTSFEGSVSSSAEVESRWSAFRPVGPRPLLPALVMGRVCGSEWLVPLPALPALSGFCTTQDVDIFLRHMNNARYVRELDFARFHFYDRTGIYANITAAKGHALQGASSIRYRRTIPIFSAYKVETRMTGFIANILLVVPSEKCPEYCNYYDLVTHNFVGPDAEVDDPLYLDRWDFGLEQFDKGVNLFPHDMSNMNGKTVKVAAFTYKPYVLLDLDPSDNVLGRDGMELRIIDEFCRWVNCTVEIVRDDENQWGEIYDNLTGVGILGNVIEDRADMGITALYSWYEEYRVMDFSASIIRTAITCIAPAARVLSSWDLPFLPFAWLTWTRDDLGNSWRIRSITGWMLVTGLIIDNAYGGGLASSFTVPKYEASIDTVQDIVDRKMEWGATHDAWIFSIILSEEVPSQSANTSQKKQQRT